MKTSSIGGVDWSRVEGVILDVDGTLFDHLGLRLPLLARMLTQVAAGRLTWRDVQTLRHFRRERDRLAIDEAESIGLLQFERAAAAAGRSPVEVEALVSRWMYREPLAFVADRAFPDARRFIAALQKRGTRTGVFSDYPAHDKLDALQISVEVVRDATSPDVGRLKPCPEGFIRVATLLNVSPERCVVLGDRDDRDGEAARRGGFMFLRKVGNFQRAGTGEFKNYNELLRTIEECDGESG